MIKFVLALMMTFLLLGCGGGGSSDSSTSSSSSSFSGDYPSDQLSGESINTWEYIVPESSTNSNSITTKSINGTSYSSTFRTIDSNTIVEIPQNAPDEKVEYKKLSDKIYITFYKNDQKTFSYSLKNSVKLGEQTTVENSACYLVNHYDKYLEYSDVIEIDCGKHKGFYAKGKGEIYQE